MEKSKVELIKEELVKQNKLLKDLTNTNSDLVDVVSEAIDSLQEQLTIETGIADLIAEWDNCNKIKVIEYQLKDLRSNEIDWHSFNVSIDTDNNTIEIESIDQNLSIDLDSEQDLDYHVQELAELLDEDILKNANYDFYDDNEITFEIIEESIVNGNRKQAFNQIQEMYNNDYIAFLVDFQSHLENLYSTNAQLVKLTDVITLINNQK